jgi:LysM repeat protein
MRKYLLLATMLLALFAFGCAKKEVKSCPEPEKPAAETQVEETEEVVVEEEEIVVEPTPMEVYKANYASLPTEHKVKKGECLWWIAEYKEVYNDPFMWPLIYKANRDKINNPDLIYPDQVFSIPRQFDLDKVKESRQKAGAPKPYLPPEEANIPAELRSELGWSF